MRAEILAIAQNCAQPGSPKLTPEYSRPDPASAQIKSRHGSECETDPVPSRMIAPLGVSLSTPLPAKSVFSGKVVEVLAIHAGFARSGADVSRVPFQ